jgi:invasion protein IalB
VKPVVFAATALLALLATPVVAQDVAALPGGASSLSEKHGSWSVNCSVAEAGKGCAFSQTAGNPQTGAALVAMELAAPAANKAEGMLLMAFGLRLDAGVQLGIDGQPLGAPRPFLTCISSGCLVPMAFEDVELGALKVGQKLDVTGVKVDDGQPVTVSMSLAGFTAAYDRTVELAR